MPTPHPTTSHQASQRALTRKIILLVTAFVIPLASLSIYFLLVGLNKDISFATQEKRGNVYQRKLEPLLRLLGQERLLLINAGAGDAPASKQLPAIEIAIDSAFTDLATVDLTLGKTLEMTPEGLAAARLPDLTAATVSQKWKNLRVGLGSLPADDAQKQMADLISDVRQMITYVGNKSNLILDPDLDTYYLMNVTVVALPQNQDRLNALACSIATQSKTLTVDQRTELAATLALMKESDLDQITSNISTSLAEDKNFNGVNQDYQSHYPPATKEYQDLIQKVLDLGQDLIANGNGTPAEFRAAIAAASAESFKFWDASVDHLDALLQMRIDAIDAKLIRGLAIALTGLLAGGAVAFFITRNLVREFGKVLHSEAGARAAAEDEQLRLQQQIHQLLVVVSDGSDGKFGSRAIVTEGVLGNVADALNLMFENVGDLIAKAQTASDRVAQAAVQISTTTLDLAAGADTQSLEVAQTSAGVTVLNEQAQLVLRNSQSATRAVANSRSAAENGVVAVRELLGGMKRIREHAQINAKKIKRLGERSMEISGIVKAIGEISAKTDMLALNASMESARAGEQGKGFSVIAEQVRSLAERTRTLTTEIERLVGSIQSETAEAVQQMEAQTQEVENGSKQVEVASGALERIVNASGESSSLVTEINAAAAQQADRASAMLSAVATIHTVTESARAKVLETSGTSEQLSQLSAKLNRELAKFQVGRNSGLN